MMLGAVAGVETVRATVETPLAWDCLPAYSRGAGGSRSVADALAAETEETAVGTRDELSSDQCALLLSSALSLRALQSDLTAGVRDCKVQRAVKAVLNVAGLSGILKQLQVPDADRICPGGGGGLSRSGLVYGRPRLLLLCVSIPHVAMALTNKGSLVAAAEAHAQRSGGKHHAVGVLDVLEQRCTGCQRVVLVLRLKVHAFIPGGAHVLHRVDACEQWGEARADGRARADECHHYAPCKGRALW